MEETRQRVQVRAAATHRKEEEKKAKRNEGASSSAPKTIGKGVPGRKVDRKDDRPSKKVFVTPEDKLPKKPSPPKSSHRVDKGLMTTLGLIT